MKDLKCPKKIGQLKLKSQDGKYRLTDITDIEGMFRIIESIHLKILILSKIFKYLNIIKRKE